MANRLEERIMLFVVAFGDECGIGPRWDEITDHFVRTGRCAAEVHTALRRLRLARQLKARILYYDGRDYGHYEVRRG